MIFVSYSWRDSTFVRKLVQRLQLNGVELWIDYLHLDLDRDIETQLIEAIQKCQIFLLLESASSRTSSWVCYEQQVARHFNKYCVTFTL